MLLVWWVFLYAFIVFPDEYVVLNVAVYSPHYDLLYLVENMAFLGVLGHAGLEDAGGVETDLPEPVCRLGTLRRQFAGAEHGHRSRAISYGQPVRHPVHCFGLLDDLGHAAGA